MLPQIVAVAVSLMNHGHMDVWRQTDGPRPTETARETHRDGETETDIDKCVYNGDSVRTL